MVKLIRFSLPFLLTSLLQLFYTTADLFTVGQFGGGSTSASAIGSNNALINLVLGLFLGLSLGVNVVISNAIGKGEKVTIQRYLQSSFVISIVSGVVVALIGFFCCHYFLTWMSTDPLVIDKATTYLKVYFLASPFIILFNTGSNALRAYGDSRSPLFVLLISGIFNIGLNLLLVIVAKMDVLGVGIATAISNAVSAILIYLVLIFKKDNYVCFTFRGFKVYKDESLEIIKHGIFSGLQSVFFSISNVIVQASVNVLGTTTIAANTACMNLESYIYFFLNAIGTGVLSMVGQNYGAKNYANVKKILKYSFILETAAGVLVGGFIILLREPLIKALLNENEAGFDEILKISSMRLAIICSTHFIDGYMECSSAFLRGLKKPAPPTIITLTGSVILRIIFLNTLFNLDYFHSYLWVTLLYPITWALTSLAYCVADTYYTSKLLHNWSTRS